MSNDDGSIMVDDPIPIELRAKALVRKTGDEEFMENDVAIAKLSGYSGPLRIFSAILNAVGSLST